METAEAQKPTDTAPLTKKRSACDECRSKKLKCTGEQPACSRCVREHIACIYSEQKQMGRPKKRQRLDATDSSDRSRKRRDTGNFDSIAGSSAWNMAPASDLTAQPWPSSESWDFSPTDLALPALTPDSGSSNNSPPLLNLPPELLNTSEIRSHHDLPQPRSTQSDFSTQMLLDPSLTGSSSTSIPSCACLSTLYLMLQSLQSMGSDFSFPSSLHPLREAMTSAYDVLHCLECPTRFLSGMQNSQLLGTLLVSIAERFSKILLHISAEADRATQHGEKKSLPLSSLNTSTTHLHPHALGTCITAFSVSLTPEEWRSLAKKVVRAEVYGASDGNHCCADLWGLTDQMLERQHSWHTRELPDDCPRHPVTGIPMGGKNLAEKDRMCVKFPMYARTLIESLDWS